ncbi:MAG: hypothetical protein ABIG44_10770 [Planctomycetota bacterium]
MNMRMSWLCVVGLRLFVTPVAAQDPPGWPQGEFIPYMLDSGKLDNADRASAVVFEKTIMVDDAAWMRLYFSNADLRPGSYVRMTSLFDGEVQELDANDLAMWNSTSAYFNGDAVYLELIAAPGSIGNRIALNQVAVEIVPGGRRGPCYESDRGICVNDDRVPSYELWAARVMPVNCSASIYNTHSCAVTAGHCTALGYADVLQFNVPHSINCALLNPPVDDQFPITDCAFKVYQPTCEDWAVMTIGTNGLGETPYERYGEYRPIASEPADVASFIEIWSYGTDNSDPDWNQVQQYSAGSPLVRTDYYYRHNCDITWGSSGGALLHNDEIVGIQSSSDWDCQNWANRIDIPEYVSAREALCPAGGPILGFSHFANCMNGPGQPLAYECVPTDLDSDADADMTDLAVYQAAFGCP